MCAELAPGTEVWTRKLHPVLIQGELARQRCGSYRALRWAAVGPLTVRRARRAWRCEGCGRRIEKGELHGSDFYTHYCLSCVTATEPPVRYEPA